MRSYTTGDFFCFCFSWVCHNISGLSLFTVKVLSLALDTYDVTSRRFLHHFEVSL